MAQSEGSLRKKLERARRAHTRAVAKYGADSKQAVNANTKQLTISIALINLQTRKINQS